MSILYYDLEADGLLPTLTKIHCVVTEDLDTGEINAYYEDHRDIYHGLLALYQADKIVGHNIISYDIPAIKKLYPRWKYKSYDDTFILSCLIRPLRPAHSIESYSEGLKVENEDWSCLTMNMLDRCVIDTMVGANVYRGLLKEIQATTDWDEAIKLEYEVAENHVKQVAAGVDVNVELVHKTIECLDCELDALTECIESHLPYRVVRAKDNYKKVFKKNGDLPDYVKAYFNPEVARSILI